MEPAIRLSDGRAQLRGGAIGNGQADRAWSDAEECRAGQEGHGRRAEQARTTGEGKHVNVDCVSFQKSIQSMESSFGQAKSQQAKNQQVENQQARSGALRPVKETFTKAALINLIAAQNDIPRKTALGVFATLESVLLGSVHPRGVGEFTLPGLLKVTLRKVPARRAGTLVRNPATGEMVKGAAKPANMRVKIRALSKLRTAASG